MRAGAIILAAAFLLSLVPAGRCPATEAGIGLFADEARTRSLVTNPGGITQFVMWIWVRPGDNGAICADYEIATPYNVIVSDIAPNPDAPVRVGEPVAPPGISICFDECRTDWFWTYRVVFYVTDMELTRITVEPHDTSGGTLITTCEPDNTTEPMCVFTDLYINYDFAVEEFSWGAVKRMLGD